MFTLYLPAAFEVMKALAYTVPQLLDQMVVWFILLVYFAVWGHQVFDTDEINAHYQTAAAGGTCDEDFSEFWKALLACFVWQTTENYPFVYYPIVAEKAYSATAFLLLLNLAMWFTEAVLIANVYQCYQKTKAVQAKRRADEQHAVLFVCFALLQDDPTAKVTATATAAESESEESMSVSFGTWFAVLKLLKPYVSAAEAASLAAKLNNKKGSSELRDCDDDKAAPCSPPPLLPLHMDCNIGAALLGAAGGGGTAEDIDVDMAMAESDGATADDDAPISHNVAAIDTQSFMHAIAVLQSQHFVSKARWHRRLDEWCARTWRRFKRHDAAVPGVFGRGGAKQCLLKLQEWIAAQEGTVQAFFCLAALGQTVLFTVQSQQDFCPHRAGVEFCNVMLLLVHAGQCLPLLISVSGQHHRPPVARSRSGCYVRPPPQASGTL